ncbi:RNASEK [Cordylochernes scorpioides]|uniref:RNASEK n=1 Tax=Cordylochernes scorpioides TaxID=51811 RepID=A0ABY6K6V1_9ARAC|nr:RNASEK [Cordylochernes scorpioides]
MAATKSIICLLLSIWGVVMLGIMGILLYVKSLAFIEDLPLHGIHVSNVDELYKNVDRLYAQGAKNCGIAAGVYLVIAVAMIIRIRVKN